MKMKLVLLTTFAVLAVSADSQAMMRRAPGKASKREVALKVPRAAKSIYIPRYGRMIEIDNIQKILPTESEIIQNKIKVFVTIHKRQTPYDSYVRSLNVRDTLSRHYASKVRSELDIIGRAQSELQKDQSEYKEAQTLGLRKEIIRECLSNTPKDYCIDVYPGESQAMRDAELIQRTEGIKARYYAGEEAIHEKHQGLMLALDRGSYKKNLFPLGCEATLKEIAQKEHGFNNIENQIAEVVKEHVRRLKVRDDIQ